MEFSIENAFKVLGIVLTPGIIWLIILYILDIIDTVKCRNCGKMFKIKYRPLSEDEEPPIHICRVCKRKLKRNR